MIIKCQLKIYLGSLFDLRIHTAVAEVRLKQLTSLIDPETQEEILEYPKFIKLDQVAIAIFELSQSGQIICMELFKDFPELDRFALCDEGHNYGIITVFFLLFIFIFTYKESKTTTDTTETKFLTFDLYFYFKKIDFLLQCYSQCIY